MVSGADIPGGDARQQRRSSGFAGHGDGAAGGEGYHIEALIVAVRAVGAESLDPSQNNSGVDLGQNVVAEAEAFHGAGPHVLGHYVAFSDQVEEDQLALFGFQVQGNTLLVRIQCHEVVAVKALTVISHFPSGIAASRGFDLDDVRSQPG